MSNEHNPSTSSRQQDLSQPAERARRGYLDRDEVLARTDLVALITAEVPLRKRGPEWVGPCPFHDEKTPSFTVYRGGGAVGGTWRFHCFGCGANGNALDWVMARRGLEFRDALHLLAEMAGIAPAPAPAGARGASPPRPRQGAKPPEAVAAEKAERTEEAAREARRKTNLAHERWNKAGTIAGFEVGAYLANERKLPPDLLAEINDASEIRRERATEVLWGGSLHTGAAMLAPFRSPAGELTALQVTPVDKAGRAIRGPNGKKRQRYLGAVSGSTVYLGGNGPATLLAEGVEDALAMMASYGLPAMAAGSLTAMTRVSPRPGTEKVIITADHDAKDQAANLRVVEAARRRFEAMGLEVEIKLPRRGEDPHAAFVRAGGDQC